LAWRRNVRHFRSDALPPGTLERLIGLACWHHAFEPRCYIDTITIDIAFVEDNVTDVDADAEFDPTMFGERSVVLDALDLYGALFCHQSAIQRQTQCKSSGDLHQ
jgi:hypothetical protein